MAISTREVLLLLRAREDTARALNSVQRNLLTAGAAADAASARAQAAAARARMEQMRITGATAAQIAAVRAQAQAWDQYAGRIEQARRRTLLYRETLRQAGEAVAAIGIGLGAAGVAGLMSAKSWIDTAVEYERQVRHTRTQVDKMSIAFEDLHAVGIRVATDLPVRFEQIQPALFDIFSSMEVGLKDAEVLLRAFSKGAIAGQVDIQSVSRATIGLLNAFRLPASQVTRVLDLQFELIQEGIGTYEEWNQRIGLVTPSAIRAGQSIEIMVAALAASTRLGTSAARSGTAVARAFDAFSNPAAVAKMRKMGIAVTDVHGNFRPMNVVLREFREELMKIPKHEDRVAKILDVFKGAGSTIEARRFLQNMLLSKDGLEIFDSILKETTGSAGNMQRAYAEMAGGVAAQTELLRNHWMVLKEGLGAALIPAFTELITHLRSALSWFNELPAGTRKTIAQFVVWGSVIGIAAGALLFMVGTLAVFVAAVSVAGVIMLKGAAIALGLVAGIIALGGAFYAAWQNSANFRDLLIGIWENMQQLRNIALETFGTMRAAFNEHLKPALMELWRVIDQEILPTLNRFRQEVADRIIPKIQEAARVLGDVWGWAAEQVGGFIREHLIPAIRDLNNWWKENEDTLRPVLSVLGQILKWIIIIAGAGGIGALVVSIGTLIAIFRIFVAVGTTVSRWYQSIISAVIALINWLRGLGDAWNRLKASIVTALWGASNAVASFKGQVIAQFAGAASWLYNAGRNLIAGLVRGVWSAVGSLRSVLSSVTNMIPNWKGPRERDARLLRPAGRLIIQGLQRGIKSELSGLRRTLQDVTNLVPSAVGTDFTGRVGLGGNQPGMFNTGTTNHFDITVHARDQDPRAVAQVIGWEVANRVG